MFDQFLTSVGNTNTRAVYRRGLDHFQRWAGEREIDVVNLRPKYILEYRTYLEASLAGASVNCYLSALRAFLKWAVITELVAPEVYTSVSVIPNVKASRRLPRPLDDQQVDDLLCRPDPSNIEGARDLAFLGLLASSGVRVSEAVNLDLENINVRARWAFVVGKGGKERKIYFDTQAASALLHYLSLRGNPTSGPLFVNYRGDRISVRYMQERVASYGGDERRLHPHDLRHTLATKLLRKTGDIHYVSQILGHSRVETTQIYVQTIGPDEGKYRKAMDDEETHGLLEITLPVAVERSI